jgi:hypothetical protein
LLKLLLIAIKEFFFYLKEKLRKIHTATCRLTVSSLSRAAFKSALAFSKAKRFGSTSQ